MIRYAENKRDGDMPVIGVPLARAGGEDKRHIVINPFQQNIAICRKRAYITRC